MKLKERLIILMLLRTNRKNDVVIHKESGEFFCRIPWFYTGRPTKRTKVITLNCNKYSVKWQ